MPLVRIDLPTGKSADYRLAIIATIQSAMHSALNVPIEEQFQVVAEHAAGNLSIDRNYLGIERSSEAIFLQITLNEGRDPQAKKNFYKAVTKGLQECPGLRREDVLINLIEVKRENWSFGNGQAQLI